MVQKEEVNLRPAVGRFAVAMEKTLRKYDSDKGVEGWTQVQDQVITHRVAVNLDELLKAVDGDNSDEIMERCVDIGNLAMMRCDNELTRKRDGEPNGQNTNQ